MSFLAGRLAATEGAFFLQESKQAVGRLAQKLPTPSAAAPKPKPEPPTEKGGTADVLPEILRHSIPLKGGPAEADPSLSTSKWILPSSSSTSPATRHDALNPLRAYVSLPQATFGPKRWQLPDVHPTFAASTANDLRHDRNPPMNSEKLKAMASGLSMLAKAFAIATTIVFGGATVVFYQLRMNSNDDIRSKGKDLFQPGVDMVREQIGPLRAWAENMSRKWHVEGDTTVKERPVIKELSKILGARSPE